MTTVRTQAAPPGEAGGVTILLRLAFLAGPMLSMLDSSVVNVAVPVIVSDLHTTLGTASWAVSGYLLGLAIGLAATPWLARRFGTRPAYGGVLAGFVAASAACALVNLSLLRSPQRSLTLALTCVASVVLFAVLFLAPVFLQEIQHRSSTVTGLVLLPQGVVMGLASWLGTVILERGKTRPALITGSIVTRIAGHGLSRLCMGAGRRVRGRRPRRLSAWADPGPRHRVQAGRGRGSAHAHQRMSVLRAFPPTGPGMRAPAVQP